MAGEERSLEETPMWATSMVFVAFLVVSYIIEFGLHYLAMAKVLRKRKSLSKALDNIQTEMMKLGFVSLMLTITEMPVSRICVSKSLASSFLPCKDPVHFENKSSEGDHCRSKGMVPLLSVEAVKQLNIFITVLAVFHVLYCLLTMFLGMAKMRSWEAWETETQSVKYKIQNDPRRFQPTRQTSFGRRHLRFWSDYPLLLWPVCFLRQFSASVTKADYYTLRNGFITANMAEGSNFNFHKFISRAYDYDFEQVVGIRLWIWIFSILFIFFSADDFYNYYWLPMIPLVVALIVGTKLEVIITKMCLESHDKNYVVRGTMPVKPHDNLFWFGRPDWLLNLLQLVMIQNSFQLAFFAWTWYKYGLRSCFNRETEEIVIRIVMGVVVQFLCGYVTLPLYALVSQMGSGMRKAVFSERVLRGLRNWHNRAKCSPTDSRLASGRLSWTLSRTNSIDSSTLENLRKSLVEDGSVAPAQIAGSSSRDIVKEAAENKSSTSAAAGTSTSSRAPEEPNARLITRRTDDIEFSFRKMLGSPEIEKINSIIEEDASGKSSDFYQ